MASLLLSLTLHRTVTPCWELTIFLNIDVQPNEPKSQVSDVIVRDSIWPKVIKLFIT